MSSSSRASRAHVVVGTAGHIDHGKSALVRALTGTDPDRWAEEKRRGITIDLGFAHAEVEGVQLAFVDVPGHERFVHNMLAGASGIDVVLLVVAADESVMPQTREHLSICRLLGHRAGVVALSRCDLADEGMPELVEEELAELLEGSFLERAPVVRTSAVSGEGLDALRAALRDAALSLPPRPSAPWPRLPIDRVFAARGFGTVVTGTLSGGELALGDGLVALPGGARARIRGLQVHGESVERAEAQRRVAVNLQGVEREELERGQVLVPPELGVSTEVFDAWVEVLADAATPLEEGQRVRVHHGTAEVMARLRVPAPGSIPRGERAACQLRCEAPLALLPGDRFIVRRYSPVVTIAGGQVADVDPPRWRRDDPRWPERTRALAEADAAARLVLRLAEAGPAGLALPEDVVRAGVAPERARTLAEAKGSGVRLFGRTRLLSREGLESLAELVAARLGRFHEQEPLAEGLAPEALRAELAPAFSAEAFREVLATAPFRARVDATRALVCLAGRRVTLDEESAARLERLVARLEEAGVEMLALVELERAVPGPGEARELLELAARRGEAVRVKEDLFLGGGAWRRVLASLHEEVEAGRTQLDVPRFKELFGVSRKYAIPLLERLDDEGVTRRAGNTRVLRKDALAARADASPPASEGP